MDQSRTPVLEALQAYRSRGDITFGPPGHRQGIGADPRVLTILGEGVFASDVLTLNGLDDRRLSHGVLEHAEALMAEAVRAERAFFSTCGSSLSVKAAMLAVAGPGEKLLISRNAHKSVVSAVVINGTQPVWVHPHFDTERHLAHPPEPEDVRRALREHPDARGMLLISPTDWGTCADIAGVAEVCHEHGVPLVVDEAWGAHLPFHDGLPAWGMDAGADVVVTSVHKMGSAIEQSSVFHLQGDRVDPVRLRQRADLLGTTSPTSLSYATLDGWRRQMVEDGTSLLGAALDRAARVRDAVADLDGIDVLGREVVDEGLAFDIDPLALTFDLAGLGITGYQAAEHVRDVHHVNLGSADTRRVSARLTHADTDARIDRLIEVLTALVAAAPTLEPAPTVDFPSAHGLELETVMRPRDAFFADVESVPVEQAVGRVAAELVSPYPPGVPVLAPGERITQEAVDYLVSAHAAGALLPDPADNDLASLRVVS
ncbi:ornithine decarboxylase [Pimelobacter simplex]|uniref:Ornithine decarboxylase n=1 Tax=Nocardioides simplex TaxID=2045 RepID=A0A7J5DZJ2_NOCSI|nr:PLP-dependent transferase [Pimelobacter simplex]KAB2811303.1 ornithine decarboxylase [Pimelobacter simplex]